MFLKLPLNMFFAKHCFKKQKSVLGHHNRLSDVMGQSYPIYACTNGKSSPLFIGSGYILR